MSSNQPMDLDTPPILKIAHSARHVILNPDVSEPLFQPPPESSTHYLFCGRCETEVVASSLEEFEKECEEHENICGINT
jgi:hypothetical protein